MSEQGEIPNVPAAQKVTVDASGPFFLHASDHPGAILVTTPLNGHDYSTWCKIDDHCTQCKEQCRLH